MEIRKNSLEVPLIDDVVHYIDNILNNPGREIEEIKCFDKGRIIFIIGDADAIIEA